jgi:hypothetical protein
MLQLWSQHTARQGRSLVGPHMRWDKRAMPASVQPQGSSPSGKDPGQLGNLMRQGRLNELIRQASSEPGGADAASDAAVASLNGRHDASAGSTAKGVARLNLNRDSADKQSGGGGGGGYAKAPARLRRDSASSPLPSPRAGAGASEADNGGCVTSAVLMQHRMAPCSADEQCSPRGCMS